jgi:outer membrane protein assembly factor BamB
LQNAGCSTGSVGVPVIADGLVYSTTGGFGSPNVVYALAGGSPAGTYDRGGIPAIRGGVGFDRLRVGRVRATELATGTELWEWPGLLESPVFGSQDTGPLVVDDVVISGNAFGGLIHGVDAATGTFLWSLDVGDGEGFPRPAFAELAVGENLLVLSRGRRVKAFRIGKGP